MQDGYELVSDDSKTTITASGGIALGYGPGPGLANANFWNRIGSLFSCYRPSVGLLNVFSAKDLHQPLHLKKRKALWHPNHVAANYRAPGIAISEDRYASKSGLHCRMRISNTRKSAQSIVLCFHGTVEQWPFFDYPRTDAGPNVRCEIDPKRREVTLTQPHPHHGLPQVVNSIQRVWLELPGESKQTLSSCGFGENEGDLRTLWHDHRALASLRMRLGQVGGRYSGDETISFAHPHPLYYMTVALELAPGEIRDVILRTDFHTDDEAGDLRTKSEQQRRYPMPDVAIKREAAAWRKYLTTEVPQLDCDDPALVRYWYYVWYVLRSNRTAPGRHIKQAFTAPSKYMYWGPWIWDGYFHVLGEMWLKDPEIVKDTIRSVLDMQFPNGFIPVCSGANYRMCFHEDIPGYKNPQGGGFASYVDPELKGYKELKHPFEAEITVLGGAGQRACDSPPGSGRAPYRPEDGLVQGTAPTQEKGHEQGSSLQIHKFIHNEKTQTPLISCALGELDGLYHDGAFAEEVFSKLKAFDDWLWRRRTDKQGRFILWHGDESGWDNATRHYPVPAKPFDVQVHAMQHRQALSIIGGGANSNTSDLWGRYQKTLQSIQSYWDDHDKWFYDLGASGDGQRTSKPRKQIAASGMLALWALASKPAAEACANALKHKRVFNTAFPIPTLAKCDPDYAPHGWGWNGPVWLQVNYFTITGLIGNRKLDEAFELWEKTKRMIIRYGKPYSYELYDPETGTGMGCPDYSWQAMVNHLVIRYFAGVNGLLLRPALPPGMNQLAISNLPGQVKQIVLKRKGKRVTIQAEFAGVCVPRVMTDYLGKAASVIANKLELTNIQADMWTLQGNPTPRKTWEIIITCL